MTTTPNNNKPLLDRLHETPWFTEAMAALPAADKESVDVFVKSLFNFLDARLAELEAAKGEGGLLTPEPPASSSLPGSHDE